MPQTASDDGAPTLTVLDLRRFGWTNDGRLPCEDIRTGQWRRARPARPTSGEVALERAEALRRHREAPGPGENRLWEVDPDVERQLGEVREPFLLRRDVARAEMNSSDLGAPGVRAERIPSPMRVFTGLELRDLQPEPFPALARRLLAP